MSLRERLESTSVSTDNALRPQAVPDSGASKAYQALKLRIHQLLLSRIDLEAMENLSPDQLREELRLMVERLLAEENVVVNTNERRDLVRDIQYEMLGLGPIEPLLADPTVSDILINGYHQIYVERRGKIELTDVTFSDDAHLMKIIDKIVSRVGRRVDESSPMVDARLPDGSRVNAIIPPLAVDGPALSIRRFGRRRYDIEGLLER